MSQTLPKCRHRGLQVSNDTWACHSSKLIVAAGLVTERDCRCLCPFVDHDGEASGTADPTPSIDVRSRASALAIAVVAAPRKVRTLERTIGELRAANFEQLIHVYAEPETNALEQPGIAVFPNQTRSGAWGNWCRAASEMLRLTAAEFILVCEDDIALSRCAAAALYHAIEVLPIATWGCVSLYTPLQSVRQGGSREGWHECDMDAEAWGALALCFSRASLSVLLNSQAVRSHRGDRDTDRTIARALREPNLKRYHHLPSLCSHIGQGLSTLGHTPLRGSTAFGFSPNYRRYALDQKTADAHAEFRSTDSQKSDPPIRLVSRQICVVVPTYNCGAYLGDCLTSLLGQTIPAEIVVVDDGSTDGTVEELKRFAPRIRWQKHPNRLGANAARMTGIRDSHSEWLVLADADALYAPNYLEKLLDATRDGSDVAYCSWERRYVQADTSQVVPAPAFQADRLWWNNYISMCSLVRRSVLPQHLGKEGALDDWILWLSLALEGRRFRAVPEKLFTAFERPEGKSAQLRADPDGYRRLVARIRRNTARLLGVEEPVSVIVPGCDSGDLTTKCLRHLAWYSGLPLDVIYIDNGSDPHLLMDLETEAESLGLPLTIIRNAQNLQFTRSVNQGFRLARGKYLLCLNNDCFIAPDCIERLYWHLTTGERVAGVGPLTGDNGHQSLRIPERRRHADVPNEIRIDFDDPLECSRLLQATFHARPVEMLAFFCILINREAIERHGLLDETIHEFASGLGADDEWCFRVRRERWTLKLALDAYAVHLGGRTFQRLQIDRQGLQKVALERYRRLLNESLSDG